jgi:hypothetical protein
MIDFGLDGERLFGGATRAKWSSDLLRPRLSAFWRSRTTSNPTVSMAPTASRPAPPALDGDFGKPPSCHDLPGSSAPSLAYSRIGGLAYASGNSEFCRLFDFVIALLVSTNGRRPLKEDSGIDVAGPVQLGALNRQGSTNTINFLSSQPKKGVPRHGTCNQGPNEGLVRRVG